MNVVIIVFKLHSESIGTVISSLHLPTSRLNCRRLTSETTNCLKAQEQALQTKIRYK